MPRPFHSELPAQAGNKITTAPVSLIATPECAPGFAGRDRGEPNPQASVGTSGGFRSRPAGDRAELATELLPKTRGRPHRGVGPIFGAALACVITANAGHKVKNTKTGPITILRGAR